MCYRPANTKPHTGEHVCPPTIPALIGGIIILLLAIAFLLLIRAPTCLTL